MYNLYIYIYVVFTYSDGVLLVAKRGVTGETWRQDPLLIQCRWGLKQASLIFPHHSAGSPPITARGKDKAVPK